MIDFSTNGVFPPPPEFRRPVPLGGLQPVTPLGVLMVRSLLVLVFAGIPSLASSQALQLVNRDDGKLVLEVNSCESAVDVFILEFGSSNGVLVPQTSTTPPFSFFENTAHGLSATPDEYSISGDLVLDEGGRGGWDVSRSEEYDVQHYYVRLPLASGPDALAPWVGSEYCGEHELTADLGRVPADRMSPQTFSGVTGLDFTPLINVSTPRIEGVRVVGSNVFSVSGFEAFENGHFVYDIILAPGTSPGIHEGEIVYDGALFSQFNGERYSPFSRSTVRLRAEVVEATYGDCNLDGHLEASDLSCVIDVFERNVLLEALGTLPGDLDGDGGINVADFLTLSRNFNRQTTSYTNGDIDLNGVVDVADFLTLSRNFGQVVPSAVVPEPAALAVMRLASFCVLSLRRRSNSPRH